MDAISLNGLAFQSIINIIIERKLFHKGSIKIDPFEKKQKIILINLFDFFVPYNICKDILIHKK